MTTTKTTGTRRHQNAQLVRTIGDRMRQARELCNMSQTEAAKLLGYQNSSKLSKIEKATNSKSIPLSVIMKASKIYEVSVDFLFGTSDDWDTGVRMTRERQTSAWLMDEWEKQRQRDMVAIRQLNDRIGTIDGAVETCISQALELSEAVNWFVSKNRRTFPNMPGGARVLSATEKLVSAAKESRANMRRYKMECRLARQPAANQKDLFEEAKDGTTGP